MTPVVTVLQLDTQFPRVAGDVACPHSYVVPIEVLRIHDAVPNTIVSNRPDLIDITPFEAAIRRAKGDIIVTSCGFLSYWQGHLAALTNKPFISSALVAVPDLAQRYTPDQVLTLTFDHTSLTPSHFGDHPTFYSNVAGLPVDMHLKQVIAQDLPELDNDRAETELSAYIATVQRPHHRHLLLECTNLPPYKAALKSATGLAITDILTLIEATRPDTIAPHFLG